MKREVFDCDICHDMLPPDEAPFVIKAHNPATGNERWKQIGCDMVLTPRGDRFYLGQAMMRINASFYCGVNPGERDEFHFHRHCIEREILTRLSQFLFQNPPPIKEGLTDDN